MFCETWQHRRNKRTMRKRTDPIWCTINCACSVIPTTTGHPAIWESERGVIHNRHPVRTAYSILRPTPSVRKSRKVSGFSAFSPKRSKALQRFFEPYPSFKRVHVASVLYLCPLQSEPWRFWNCAAWLHHRGDFRAQYFVGVGGVCDVVNFELLHLV